MQAVEKLIEILLSQIESSLAILVILIFLILFAVGWLLTKANELETLKNLFSKDQSEELKKAREDLKDVPEEAAFYDEAMREEIFHNRIRIRCCKEYREIYQRLVREGIASTEGIYLAQLYIHNKNSKIEIRFKWCNWIWLAVLALLALLGSFGMPLFLFNLLTNFNPSTFSPDLLVLSISILCYFGALKNIMPIVTALGIRKRLRKWEDKNGEQLSSSSIQTDTDCEQGIQEI